MNENHNLNVNIYCKELIWHNLNKNFILKTKMKKKKKEVEELKIIYSLKKLKKKKNQCV